MQVSFTREGGQPKTNLKTGPKYTKWRGEGIAAKLELTSREDRKEGRKDKVANEN
jgi:hypothetical protein